MGGGSPDACWFRHALGVSGTFRLHLYLHSILPSIFLCVLPSICLSLSILLCIFSVLLHTALSYYLCLSILPGSIPLSILLPVSVYLIIYLPVSTYLIASLSDYLSYYLSRRNLFSAYRSYYLFSIFLSI